MNVKFLPSILDVPADKWDDLFNTSYPFIQHAFLSALEQSGCTQTSTGWQPQHIAVYQADEIVALMPCFLKTHSYGEYVFDWAWANAYQQHGLNYYPKLLSAIPFTPASGPRLAFSKNISSEQEQLSVIKLIDQTIRDKFIPLGLSSWHAIFSTASQSKLLEQCEWKQRTGIQYHWFNNNYSSFDDFLQTFKSRKRKTVRKERQSVIDQGITLSTLDGSDISEEIMGQFYRFYQLTYLKRSGQHGYLNLAFFQMLLTNLSDNLVMVCATKDEILIAAALCFKDNETLYGRYWGCEEEHEFLHFEACYYQGIEYCIKHNLKRFDPGTQGEHKIPRGFQPIKTYSNHVVLNDDFRRAIYQFIDDEKLQVNNDIKYLHTLLPFKLEAK